MIETRNKIIEAALEEFSEYGFDEASLESVAIRAVLEPGVVRALFIDKENLLQELFKDKTEPMVNAIDVAVQEIDDVRELVRRSLELLDQWLLLHPEVIKLYLRCSLDESNVFNTIFQRYLLPSEFFTRLQQFIDQKKLRCDNLLVLSLLLDSLIIFFHMMLSGMKLHCPRIRAGRRLQNRGLRRSWTYLTMDFILTDKSDQQWLLIRRNECQKTNGTVMIYPTRKAKWWWSPGPAAALVLRQLEY